MPRGKAKRGEFDFTIWFADGARLQWYSTRSNSDAEIAAAIRRYLVPVMERIESATTVGAVSPMTEGSPSTIRVESPALSSS